MQQRQLRLGDILDDYCPRERRVTNHAVVAMIGPDVKQTRCTTCDTEHEYKHAKVPRQRRKAENAGGPVLAGAGGGPKRVVHEPALAIDRALATEPALAVDGDAPADARAGRDGRDGVGRSARVRRDPGVARFPRRGPGRCARMPRKANEPKKGPCTGR